MNAMKRQLAAGEMITRGLGQSRLKRGTPERKALLDKMRQDNAKVDGIRIVINMHN